MKSIFRILTYFAIALLATWWVLSHPKPVVANADFEMETSTEPVLLKASMATEVPVHKPTPLKSPNFPSWSLLYRIEGCESGHNPLARNTHSTAKGSLQFLDGSWKHYGKQLWGNDWVNKSVFSLTDSRELGQYVLNRYGTSPWNASKSCWG